MGKKLVIDRVQCRVASEVHDEIYFLVMRVDSDCEVSRVGPLSAWNNLDEGDERKTDVVLVENFKGGTYLLALVEEDDCYDFDADLRKELSKSMRVLFASESILEKEEWLLAEKMRQYFSQLVDKKATNDDVQDVVTVTAPEHGALGGLEMFVGSGSIYYVFLKLE